MQGKGLSDQQAKIYPPPGNRLPEGSRLPEQWQPTDDDLLHLVLQQPLITLIELLRQLWLALPYWALPGEDSATQTRRRWRPLAPGGRITTATAAAWLRARPQSWSRLRRPSRRALAARRLPVAPPD